MKLSIEDFISVADWTTGTGVSLTLNDHPEYMADNQTASLQVAITAGNGIVKDLTASPIDVTDYDELTFHIKSFNKASSQFITNGTFYYTLDLGGGKVYTIPTAIGFTHVTLYIGDLTSITKIDFQSVGEIADTVILSAMVASKDELPLDIFISIKSALQKYLDSKLSFSMGTIASATIGDTSVTVVDPQWLEEMCIVKIVSDGNTEYHQVQSFQDGILKFTTLYDGRALLYGHTSALVSFYLPVNYGDQKEIILPGITLWEDDEKVREVRNQAGTIIDTRTETDFQIRGQCRYTDYSILVDLEAWQMQVMKEAKMYVMNWIERGGLWINGKHFFFEGNDNVTLNITSKVEGIDIVPKTQYNFKIQIGVNLWERTTLVKATTTTLEVEPE